MASVTGNVKDALSITMGNRQIKLVFRPNKTFIQAASTTPGTIHPTEEVEVVPAANGDFIANLVATTVMLPDAWYDLRIEWLDGTGPVKDCPQWRIRVPVAGGTLDQLIDYTGPTGGGGGGTNQKLWWVSLTEPQQKSNLWLKQNPDNTDDPANTGKVYEWRP
jgi:hypothetical protein